MSRDRSPRRWAAGSGAGSGLFLGQWCATRAFQVSRIVVPHKPLRAVSGGWSCVQRSTVVVRLRTVQHPCYEEVHRAPSRALGMLFIINVITENSKKIEERGSVPSTHDGAALVVPATCPGKQEHFTVCDRSSILFLLQQRCSATTSQVPVRT